jgi:hypothetical protein
MTGDYGAIANLILTFYRKTVIFYQSYSHRQPPAFYGKSAGTSDLRLRSIEMTLIYPNIVPEDNLRLPDALTIKYGPARLLATFVLEGDKAARQQGIRLRVRNDFEELLY